VAFQPAQPGTPAAARRGVGDLARHRDGNPGRRGARCSAPASGCWSPPRPQPTRPSRTCAASSPSARPARHRLPDGHEVQVAAPVMIGACQGCGAPAHLSEHAIRPAGGPWAVLRTGGAAVHRDPPWTRHRAEPAAGGADRVPAGRTVLRPASAPDREAVLWILRARVDTPGLPQWTRAVVERVIRQRRHLPPGSCEEGTRRRCRGVAPPGDRCSAMTAAGITARKAVCRVADPQAAR
jgi:hypothetical protein